MQDSVTCRDLDGYFDHVYTVHPFASIVTTPEWSTIYGKAVYYSLNQKHTFIEGKVGRFKFLKRVFPLNFLISQVLMINHLRRLIKKEGIRTIRVGDMLYLGIMGWLLSKLCRIPLAIRVGGNHDKIFQSTGKPIQGRFLRTRKIEKKVERFIFPRAHLVAAVNQDNLDFALTNCANPDTATIFRYGNLLYEGHFMAPKDRKEGHSLLRELGAKESEFLICIGRLELVKHPDEIIKVLDYVHKQGLTQVKALVVGDGTMREEMTELANSFGIGSSVIFTGNRDQDWLSRVLPLSGVVVSPLTGRALSEAAFAGAPTIAYDIDWQGELVKNEKTGLLVPYLDLEAFSKGTVRLLQDLDFANQMGTNLRDAAIDMLSPEKLNAHEVSEYEKLRKRYFNEA